MKTLFGCSQRSAETRRVNLSEGFPWTAMRGAPSGNVAQGFSPAIPAALKGCATSERNDTSTWRRALACDASQPSKGCATSERDDFNVAQGFSPAIRRSPEGLRHVDGDAWRAAQQCGAGL